MTLSKEDRLEIEELIQAKRRKITDGSLTNAKIASVENTLKGNTGDGLDDLTPAEVRTLTDTIGRTGLSYITGQYYFAAERVGATTTLAMTAGRMYLFPFIPRSTLTLASLNVYVTTGVGGTDVEFLVYSSSATTRAPDVLLYESGAIDAETSSANATASSGLPTLTGGVQYWIGLIATGTSTVRALSSAGAIIHECTTAAAANVLNNLVLRHAQTIGAAADPFVFVTGDLTSGNFPAITFVPA